MWLLMLLACGQKDDSAVRAELEATRAELVELRKDVDLLLDLGQSGHPAAAPPTAVPAPLEVESHEPARRLVMDPDMGALQQAMDEDLEGLEAVVDENVRQLERLEVAVDDLVEIINNHADLIDVLGGEIEVLDGDLEGVRSFEGVIVVENGQVRILDANLVLVPGRDAKGRAKMNGQLLTETPPP